MRHHAALTTTLIHLSVLLVASGSTLAAVNPAGKTPRSLPFVGPNPPPWAPSVQEHAARAVAWRSEHAGTPGPGPAANEPGLFAWRRFAFPPMFLPQSGMKPVGPGLLSGISGDGVLGVFDGRRGAVLGALQTGEGTSGFDVGIGPRGPRALFEGVSPDARPQGFSVVDLSDAAHPSVIAHGEPCVQHGVVLPGASLGFVWGSRCAWLISMDDGRLVQDFGWPVVGGYGTMLDGSPMLLVWRRGNFYNDPTVLEAWWLQNSQEPERLWDLTVSPYSVAWFDSPGELVAIRTDSEITVRDLRTGAPLSVIVPSAAPRAGAFVDAGGTRVLALASDSFVELIDVIDPSAPRSLGTVPAQTQSPLGGWAQADPPLLARTDRPWLAVATADPPGFEVLDVSDASVIATYVVDHTTPSALAWTDLDDGTPAVVWSGYWFDQPDRHADGGIELIDTVAVDPATGPRLVARYDPVLPRDIDAVVPVAGRYAAVVDLGSNAIVLVDSATGQTVDAFGFSQQVWGGCWWYSPIVAAAGSTFVVGDGCAAEIVDVSDGRMIRRGGIAPPGGSFFSDLAVTFDGSVLSLWPDAGLLLATRPDGRVESLTVGPSRLTRMELDGTGHRVALTSGDVWAAPDSSMIVVAADPPGLRALWSNAIGAVFATFVRDDLAIAATVQKGYRYGPRLFDATTGAPLGPIGDMAEDFYYFGPGVRFGGGAAERLVYWNWTWCAWSSAVFDISKDTPRLLGVSDEYLWDPQQLSRDDGKTAFEVRDDETRVVDADGAFVLAGGDRGFSLRKLRHGFWTGYADAPYWAHRTAVLFRDPAANRPPSGNPGPDRTLECAAPAGTPAHLDGGASTDPDSTPGTQDDIVGYAWFVGGTPAGTGPTTDVVLPVGSTTARLEVTDALGLSSAKDSALRVVDTIPPTVALGLAPLLPPDGVWAHRWSVTSLAEDFCDGAFTAPVLLALSGDVLSAPVTWTRSAVSAVEVIRSRAGLSVRLLGPEEGWIRAQWSAAVSAGGLAPAPGDVALMSADAPPRGTTRGLIARYELTDDGAASAAAVYGPGADIPFVATAADVAGNVGTASTSLLRAEAERCAAAPASVDCRGGSASLDPRSGAFELAPPVRSNTTSSTQARWD